MRSSRSTSIRYHGNTHPALFDNLDGGHYRGTGLFARQGVGPSEPAKRPRHVVQSKMILFSDSFSKM